jgi:protein-S-isoprenylcysteine O-methyltransferase Ste14
VNNLARKSIIGFTQLVVALGLALFVSAGTLEYAQAWVYLLIFVGSAGLISVYLWRKDPALLERRVSAGPTAERETSQKIIQSIAAIAFVATLVVPGLDRRFGWSRVPIPVSIVGDVLEAVGFFVVFLVFRENSFASAAIEVAAEQKLIATGPYAVVRHPMYSGALLMLFGTPIALGSWWGLLVCIPMAMTIVWRLIDEEAYLSKNLPGYPEYRRQVRYRLIPLVW